MKVTLILPAIGKKTNEKYLKSWLMEPLTIAVLSSLLPADCEREFYDDRIESINYDTDTDVVLITVETYTAKRAYYISEQFRKRGKKVVMGGYHVTLVPDEAAQHCDAIMINNCGENINRLLEDLKSGNLQKQYVGKPCIDYKMADRSIYRKQQKKYLPVSLVETGRGCFHNCEFCSIAKYYDSKYIHRDVADIIAEMKSCKHKLYFLVDDSIFSNKEFARELFTEIKKLHVTWTTQITLDIAKDDETLRLMKDSGCEMVLIGFESINSGNLKQMNKEWTARLGERDELIEKIHEVGISIYASFVFGFDEDTEESFIQTLKFAMKHQFFVIAFNHLLTFPNTPTYKAFQEEGRLICDKWWLQEGYTFGTISFVPKNVTAEELRALCRKYKTRFFEFRSIVQRGVTCFRRTKKLLINFAYWYINILFHFEVDQRIGIPVGENLEEAKK
ncbi:B12-binding domain-containing radical SAM protein [Butyrivibrio sp. NC2007]|uniref:B12-binding domain-containing radical SAM protein n=1 Tax=Butyrivibrio sp. NC2007 TaxID=1280683 RepID=UPI0003B60962|nr:B12-binding domain-containing radical SAM protein [Butyrivibrio sp. NC2007]